MGVAAVFGRKTTTDVGIGNLVIGNQRGTIFGSKTYNSWIIKFGGRFGKKQSGDASGWVEFAIYKASGTTVTNFVGKSNGTVQVTGVMQSGSGGSQYTKPPLVPIQRWANQVYSLHIRGDAGNFNHGQDHSGARMHRNVGFAYPDPYNADSNDPEGNISTWADEITNTKPKTPTNVTPGEDAFVVSTLPEMGCDFRDDEEVLTGFTLGQADKVKKYQFKILNEAGTTVLKDSTILTATGAQQTARRVTWTPTGGVLAAGRYQAQAVVYDMFDEPSPTKTWYFTINSGGNITVHYPDVTRVSNDPLVTVYTNPNVRITWAHDQGFSTASFEQQIRQESTGLIVRSGAVTTQVIANGAVVDKGYPGSFTALTPGYRYRHEVRATDSSGATTGYFIAPWIHVNAPPGVPSSRNPTAGKTITAAPALSATFADLDDAADTLLPEISIWKEGLSAVTISSASFTYQGNGIWATSSGNIVTSNGLWNWQIRAADKWGTYGPWSSTQTFNLASAPVRTLLVPADGSTITSPTPTLSATIDRVISSWSITLTAAGVAQYTTGVVVNGTISHTVAAGSLRNKKWYTMKMIVNTSDGLTTEYLSTFYLEYIPEPILAGYSAVPSPGNFEPTADQFSEVTMRWDAVVMDASLFGGYVMRRTDTVTGVSEVLAVLPTTAMSAYIDRTPRSHTNYRYTATYLKRFNVVEWNESAPAENDVSVYLKNAVLSDLAVGGISVPITTWSDRGVRHQRSVQVVETYDEKPITFQGVLNYQVLSVSYDILSSPDASYTSEEVIDAFREIIKNTTDVDGDPVPRILCWRDPRRRIIIGTVTDFEENDPHMLNRSAGRLEITENATYDEVMS